MDFDAACDYLISLARNERRHGQVVMKREAMLALLASLGNPQFGRKTAHIAGSKGKGSTSTFIASILTANRNTTAHFTSPHLHLFTERICINQEKCDQKEFAQLLTAMRDEIETVSNGEHGPVSTFGALTGMFFQLAKSRQVDWQVIEAGLGGLNDATNVLEKTEIVIFTAISLEHTAILGNTTIEIAENKAGIIRPGSIVILAPQQDPRVTEVIRRHCRNQQAELVEVEQRYRCKSIEADSNSQLFEISTEEGDRRFSIQMLGKHQLDNASTAIAAIDALVRSGEAISRRSLEDGLANAYLPGRVELLPGRPSVVVDGAHNAESLAALLSALKTHFRYKKLVVILGAAADKDIEGMVAVLDDVSAVIACPIQAPGSDRESVDAERILQLSRAKGISSFASDSVSLALNEAYAISDEDDLICVTGSLYLVAKARQILLPVV